jgi:hypothetical protein
MTGHGITFGGNPNDRQSVSNFNPPKGREGESTMKKFERINGYLKEGLFNGDFHKAEFYNSQCHAVDVDPLEFLDSADLNVPQKEIVRSLNQ